MTEYQYLEVILRAADLLLIPAALYVFQWLHDWRAENKTRDDIKSRMADAQQRAVLALLRDRICQSGHYFIELGAIPSRVKQSLIHMGEAYEEMGGNGEGHEIIEDVRKLPVDDYVLKHKGGTVNK